MTMRGRARRRVLDRVVVHQFDFRMLRAFWVLVVLIIDGYLFTSAQSIHNSLRGSIYNSNLDSVHGLPASLEAATLDLPDAPLSLPFSSESSTRTTSGTLAPMMIRTSQPPNFEKFSFKGAFTQTFSENLFFHIWRVSFDPGMRSNLAHKPFFHDWFASYGGYNLRRWGDGDNFIVNDVGHPLEGAVFANTFINNSPRSQVAFGNNPRYWTSRLKSMAWAAAWSVQLEIGPISETSFGNQGGFTYVPDCGITQSCLDNPQYKKPPTNNTGLSDFIVTPIAGTAVVIGEDLAERYLVAPLAVRHRILAGRVLRSAIEPTRSFSAIFAGKYPWDLPNSETNFMRSSSSRWPPVGGPEDWSPIDRVEVGPQYTNITLPVLSRDCPGRPCRKNLSGTGVDFGYNFIPSIGFDSSLNFIPGQQGGSPMMEGLFGFKFGARFEHIGIFGKVRPGFIYYDKAMPGGGNPNPTNLTRFATDFGGVVELYHARRSVWRIDLGTTLVRYLADYPDPKQYPLGTRLSSDYIITQGNFQISTSYKVHF